MTEKTSKQSVFSQAHKLYSEGDFVGALKKYQEAAKLFGDNVVKLNIELCKKRLNAKVNAKELDPLTELMILNDSGKRDSKRYEELIKYYRKLENKKSENAATKSVNPRPEDWPDCLELSPLPESVNDFNWVINQSEIKRRENLDGLSIVIPTFNRSHLLSVTLWCLVNQNTDFKYEVIVADDGSSEDICSICRQFESKIDIKYVRQRDYGYQLSAVRNLGLRTAKYSYVSILDCDMAPSLDWVEGYMVEFLKSDDVALIGPRKYVDTRDLDPKTLEVEKEAVSRLPQVRTNNNVAGREEGEVSVDWRLEHFKKTDNLRLCTSPFRYFSGGNVAFHRKWLEKIGYFDEEFNHWGGEDNEFGYRLFRAGCFFKAEHKGLAYHQEPPGLENETDRAAGKKITMEIVKQKVPFFYRQLLPPERVKIFNTPLVSIYIPAYNCVDTIERCVNSALNQTVTDLEICICDDGSTDGTSELLETLYSGHPRVSFIKRENGGIGPASNTAVRMTRGYYIGQLDSDDFLEPDAVKLCIDEFKKDFQLACVYTTNRNVNPDGSLIANGYNWPIYSREKLTVSMICHHFRMFTARAWNLTSGFDEKIENAVDYDMYLKLSEVGPFKHINKICYNRVIHGENTSIRKQKEQKINHFKVVGDSLKRQGINNVQYLPLNDKDNCRKYKFEL